MVKFKNLIMFVLAVVLIVSATSKVFAAAETLTGLHAAAGYNTYGKGQAGDIKMSYGSYDVAVVTEDGDIFKICKVPAGATIIGGYFRGDRIDTNATETIDLDIGWAANGASGTYDGVDTDGLGNLGVLTGDAFTAGNISNVVAYCYPFSGLLVTGVFPKFTAETTITIYANDASATFAAGTLSIVVFYTME
jgi:hypothetical protein